MARRKHTTKPAVTREQVYAFAWGAIAAGQAQPAAPGPDAKVEQLLHRDRAAHFIAVGEGVDHDMRPGQPAVEGEHIGNPGIALGIRTDVREGDLDCGAARHPFEAIAVETTYPLERQIGGMPPNQEVAHLRVAAAMHDHAIH